MIRLDRTSRSLGIVLGGAVATNQLQVIVSGIERVPTSAATQTPVIGFTQISTTNSATDVTICAAPLVNGRVREVESISVRNRDTAAVVVSIEYDDNGTDYVIFSATLSIGDFLVYSSQSGWQVFDSTGQLKVSSTFVQGMIIGDGITGGTATRVLFTKTGPVLGDDAEFTYNDTTNVLAVGGSTFGTSIELGNGSDTTLSRTAAGRVAIETLGIVKGPASSTDNALARFDATTGELVQNSSVVAEDSAAFNINLVATGGSSWARKNAIIGGDFSTNPWQRGTSFTSVATATYTADRWRWGQVGVGAVDISRSADAPTVAQAGVLTNHCLLTDCTTVDASIAATDLYNQQQYIEGFNFLPLAQKAMTLSFWHKHTKTGTYCVSLKNAGNDRSYIAEYTQAVTDTWEFSTISISASPSAGTWDYTNGIGLQVGFTIAAGSNFQTTAGAWQTGNFTATSNQVNGMDSTSNNFRIALVQLEAGSVATEFESRTFQEELALCQRYYYEDAPLVGVANTTSNIARASARHPVPMRTAPTMTVSSSTTFFDGGATATSTGSISGAFSTVDFAQSDLTTDAVLTATRPVIRIAGSGRITLSAEL